MLKRGFNGQITASLLSYDLTEILSDKLRLRLLINVKLNAELAKERINTASGRGWGRATLALQVAHDFVDVGRRTVEHSQHRLTSSIRQWRCRRRNLQPRHVLYTTTKKTHVSSGNVHDNRTTANGERAEFNAPPDTIHAGQFGGAIDSVNKAVKENL